MEEQTVEIQITGNVGDYRKTLDLILPVMGIMESESACHSLHIFDSEQLCVTVRGEHTAIGCSSRPMLARGLSYFRANFGKEFFEIQQRPVFDTVGIMLDCSRNLVPTLEAAKQYLLRIALMGMNLAMLYTEDTFEIPGEPYFGYLRGRFTPQEIRQLDDFADALGIELVPCIQTLGHLTHMLKWDAYHSVRNTLDILLAEEEETYVFLEKAIRAASEPYRSKRIHLGLDEADEVASGIYETLHGRSDAIQVMHRHISRVLQITKKLGLKPMMWSDMYFTPVFGEYYEQKRDMPQAVIESVQKEIQLVFWDYYHEDPARYDHMYTLHRQLGSTPIFAGGIYTWMGLLPDYVKTLNTMVPALQSAKKNGIKEVFATIWFNDGAECSAVGALYGCQLFAEFCYTGIYCEAELKQRFMDCCGVEADAFLGLSEFDYWPGDMVGDEVGTRGSAKRSKNLLYEDPLLPVFEKDFSGMELESYFSALALRYRQYAMQYPDYATLFGFAGSLAELLRDKAVWRIQAPLAVRTGNREKAGRLAELAMTLKAEAEAFAAAWRTLWHQYNKPYGFELNDIRVGGLAARFATAAQRMQQFADAKLEDIPELSCEKLPFSRDVPGAPNGCVRKQTWHSIASVDTLGGYTNLKS